MCRWLLLLLLLAGGQALPGAPSGLTILVEPSETEPMALAHVQSREFTGVYPMTTGALAFLSNVTAGNLIVVAVSHYIGDANHTISVTDSLSNTYQTDISGVGAGSYHVRLFYAMNIAGGANTVTVEVPDSSDLWFTITEISGAATTSALDISGTASGGTATPTVSITTTVADTILFGIFNHEGSDRTLTPGAGFTQIEEQEGGSTVMPGLSEYQIVTSSGSKTVNGTLGSAATWNICAAAFKAAATATLPRPLTLARDAVHRSFSW